MSISKWLYTSAVLRRAQSDNACLMLRCPGCVRQHLHKQGLLGYPGAEPDNLHCTLLFLGPANKVTPEIQENLSRDLEGVIKQHGPQNLKFTGLGTFAPGEKGTPFVSMLDGLNLNKLRDDAEKVCLKHLKTLPNTHGFIPHVTLGYLPEGEPHDLPTSQDVELGEWTADRVSLVAKDKVLKEFPLNAQAVEGDISDRFSDPQGVQRLTQVKWRPNSHDPYPIVRGEKIMGISTRLRALTKRKAASQTYKEYFDGMLGKWKVKSPAELSDEDKKKFFDEVDKGWKAKEE